jgi:transposase
MKKVRREFSPEFKAEAVRLVRAGGKPVTDLARELNVPRQLLYVWVRQADEHQGRSLRDVFPGHGKRTSEQAEIDRLQRENARLKTDIEILKKFKAFAAKHRQ